jgi:hypothetical protein
MSSQFVLIENNNHIRTQEHLDELSNKVNADYKEYEISSAVIGSELQAYFPHTYLSKVWGSLQVFSNSFSENVTDFCRLTAEVTINTTESIDFFHDRQIILQQKDNIIQRILNSEINAFKIKPFQLF